MIAASIYDLLKPEWLTTPICYNCMYCVPNRRGTKYKCKLYGTETPAIMQACTLHVMLDKQSILDRDAKQKEQK